MEPLESGCHLHKLKNRIINFRVTDEELARLKSASDQHGARCLSDFARSVMLGTADSSPGRDEGQMEEKIHALDGRLSAVESDLLRLMNKLSHRDEPCQEPEE